MKKVLLQFILLIILATVFVPNMLAANYRPISQIVATDTRLTKFNQLAQLTGLTNQLDQHGPYTLFAPTDAALNALGTDTLQQLQANPTALRQIVLHHLVYGSYRTKELLATTSLRTALGKTITITPAGTTIRINDNINLVTSNIMAENGIVHLIDAIILPEGQGFQPAPPPEQNAPDVSVPPVVDINRNTIYTVLKRDPQFSQFVALIEQTGQVNVLNLHGKFTAFAPTNAALATLTPEQLAMFKDEAVLRQFLLYHVVMGAYNTQGLMGDKWVTSTLNKGIRVNGNNNGIVLNNQARVVQTEKSADNGFIHAIDRPLTLPSGKYTRFPVKPEHVADSISEVLRKDSRLQTFSELIETASLDWKLATKGAFTVLAPTDEAFRDLPNYWPERWLENHTFLRRLLNNHISEGTMVGGNLRLNNTITALSGWQLQTGVNSRSQTVLRDKNGKEILVTVTDIQASNGVIHIIDTVVVGNEGGR